MTTRLEHPITKFRREKGWSVSDFAEAMGVDRTTTSKIEHGHRNGFGSETHRRIAKKSKGCISAEQLDSFQWPDGAARLLKVQAAWDTLHGQSDVGRNGGGR